MYLITLKVIRMWKIVWLSLSTLLVVSCTPDNEHFCAKYSYYYDELSQPGILPLADIKQQLESAIKKSGSEKDKLMLLVLEDKEKGLIRHNEAAIEYCMRAERWKKVQ